MVAPTETQTGRSFSTVANLSPNDCRLGIVTVLKNFTFQSGL